MDSLHGSSSFQLSSRKVQISCRSCVISVSPKKCLGYYVVLNVMLDPVCHTPVHKELNHPSH